MKRLSSVLLFAALSCSPDTAPLTQLMVVVDSNVAGIDSVTVRVEGMDGGDRTAAASSFDELPLPRTVAIVHRGGKLGPITVIAQALRNTLPVVTQRARVSFVSGENMMLRFDLDASCLGKTCNQTETCEAGACKDYHVESDELEEWPGSVPDNDGGILVGGSGGKSGSGGAAGTAGKGGSSGGGNGGNGGSAGSAGSPPLMCTGGCPFDASATAPHGSRTCDNGACTLHCDAGYTSADQNDLNGCEHRVTAFGWTPSNFNPGADALLTAAVDKLVINCSGALDFGATLAPSVSICGQQLQPVLLTQSTGPELVAIAMRGLSVTPGSKFSFGGLRPVVIVVYGDADIDGELDVSAVGVTGAAGSNTGCSPTGAGASGTNDDSAGGGGGGGLGTRGGDGARGGDLTQAAGGLGGQAASELRLTPLRGGCGGGAGGRGESLTASPGGAGGGALQVSVAGSLRIKGVIAAAGGGGQAAAKYGDGGAGGGSGGAILLEGTTISLDAAGWLAANGGGGGGGRNYYKPDAGADGAHSSSIPASGGTGTTTSPGGSGAAGDIVAASAPAPSGCLYPSAYGCGGGGGGGGAGRVVLRANSCDLMGGVSPTAACMPH